MFVGVDGVGGEVGECASWRGGGGWRGRHAFVPEWEALRQASIFGLLPLCQLATLIRSVPHA